MLRASPAAGGSRVRILSLAQIAISAALLGWLFSNPQTRRDAMELATHARWSWLVAGVGAAGLGFAAGIARWILVLRLLGLQIPALRAAAIQSIGLFFDLFLLGAAGGDSMKVFLLVRDTPGKIAASVMAVILDHLAGLLALLAAVAAFTIPRLHRLLESPAASPIVLFLFLYVALCLLAAALVAAIAFFPPPGWVGRRPFFQHHGPQVHLACRAVFRKGHLTAGAISASFVSWTSHFGAYLCGALAVGVNVKPPDLFAVLPVSEALSTIPVTIAGLGLRENSLAALLGALASVPPGAAVLVSLAGFACVTAWSLPGAAVFAVRGLTPPRP